jgi:hypothetical protein
VAPPRSASGNRPGHTSGRRLGQPAVATSAVSPLRDRRRELSTNSRGCLPSSVGLIGCGHGIEQVFGWPAGGAAGARGRRRCPRRPGPRRAARRRPGRPDPRVAATAGPPGGPVAPAPGRRGRPRRRRRRPGNPGPLHRQLATGPAAAGRQRRPQLRADRPGPVPRPAVGHRPGPVRWGPVSRPRRGAGPWHPRPLHPGGRRGRAGAGGGGPTPGPTPAAAGRRPPATRHRSRRRRRPGPAAPSAARLLGGPQPSRA